MFLLKHSHDDFCCGVNCTLRLVKHFNHTFHPKIFLDL